MSALWRWLPQGWQQRWLDLSGRERAGLSLALGLLTLALVWSVGVEPAWRQWQQGQARTLALQTQASALNAQSRVRPDEAVRLLQTSVATLGPGASLVVNGDLATVQIKAATAAAVSQWLTQARVQAQALPVQARLGRSTATGASSPTGNLVAPATAGHSTTAAPVGALGAISAPATPQNPAPSPGATPGSGPVWWEGQIVLQLPAPAKP